MAKRALSDRDIVRLALQDGIDYQMELWRAYAHIPDDPYIPEIKEMIENYKRVLRKRYGEN